jgi:carboxypeptidase C (cathepsin A)
VTRHLHDQEFEMLKRCLVIALVAWAALPVFAQRRGGQPQAPSEPAAATAAAQQPNESGAGRQNIDREVATAAEEKISQTSHTVRLDGRELKYLATAGTLPIRLDDGKVAARMFFVAYTKDGEDVKTRPVSFLYNGGPGSPTVWLHMGSFGPRRVQMGEDGVQPAPPFRLVDNEYSLLDVTDLVFVDAIDTGYSRGVAGVNTAQFHGQTGDIRSFGEFIAEYLKMYGRWSSPKFLIGESYGTIRSAGLSAELQSRHGIELNGIALISSLLTYQTVSLAPDNDVAYAVMIPTYTATAWYHKKLAADLQRDLKHAVDEAKAFALGDYLLALARGNTLSDAERKAMAVRLSRYTGLPEAFVLDSNLRVSADRYRKELLRAKRVTIGRYDSRLTALDLDAAGEREEFDPSDAAVNGAFRSLFQDYVRLDLKWESDLHYPSTSTSNVRPWTYDQNRYMDMTEALRSTMAKNPFLKVFVACGYFDMATPLAGSEFNFSHLAYDRPITDRVSFGYYESGHMVYLRPSAHKALKRDLAAFVLSSAGGRMHTPAQ